MILENVCMDVCVCVCARFKQFLPLFSKFDLDIWILRVKIYIKHLF